MSSLYGASSPLKATPASVLKSGYNSVEAREKARAFKFRHLAETQLQGGLDSFVLPDHWNDARYVYGSK